MSKIKQLGLFFIVAVLAVGVLAWTGCKKKTTMLVLQSGKVYPSPENGDVLEFLDRMYRPRTIKWIGTGATSPCLEQQGANPQSAVSSTCTVNYKNKKMKMFHYVCVSQDGTTVGGCNDPVVPGPRSGGGGHGGDGKDGAPGAGGNILSGEAGLNSSVSGVYYFPSDGSLGGYIPIPVTVYPMGSNKYDQVIWENDGDEPWQVYVPAGTCQDGTTNFSDQGANICTVIATQSLNYCVVYNGNTAGVAVMQIVGGSAPTNTAPPPCPQ